MTLYTVTVGKRTTRIRLDAARINRLSYEMQATNERDDGSLDEEGVALDLAVIKMYGSQASWRGEYNDPMRGQVTWPDGTPGCYRTLTPTVRAEVEVC